MTQTKKTKAPKQKEIISNSLWQPERARIWQGKDDFTIEYGKYLRRNIR